LFNDCPRCYPPFCRFKSKLGSPMWSRGVFPGSVTINGASEHLLLYVFLPETSISIQDKEFTTCQHGTHRSLSFSPCTLGMLRTSNRETLQTGKHYEISGSLIGTFVEGCSAAYGEGKYDTRCIQSIRLDIKYFRDGIDVAVSGVASPAKDDDRLSPWSFILRFTIPRSEVPNFFNLNELGESTFAWEYDEHAPIRSEADDGIQG
jgi:hypothetical protein